jgi:xylan 1,4-beta-xylosidase
MKTRRDVMKSALFAAGGAAIPATASAATADRAAVTWRRGPENRRIADLGNGTYLNPVLAGDYADPTVLRDGDEYFMTNTSHDANPGIVIWRSPDLVNWAPIGPILFKPIGTVWAARRGRRRAVPFVVISEHSARARRLSRIGRGKVHTALC